MQYIILYITPLDRHSHESVNETTMQISSITLCNHCETPGGLSQILCSKTHFKIQCRMQSKTTV